MSMSLRERILAVYQGKTPDVVPYMLDLSHWFYQRNNLPWDLSQAYPEPEYDLIDFHKKMGVGFYVPNLASFFKVEYTDDVRAEVIKCERNGTSTITWRYDTHLGSIERTRVWEDTTYAWGILNWGVNSVQDLQVLTHVLCSRKFIPNWECLHSWQDYIGEHGVACVVAGYSAMGQLLNYWMGIENTMYAVCDYPAEMRDAIDRINHSNLELIDLLAQSPAEIVIMGDNFSSDVQPPSFYDTWSRPYYAEAIRRLHAAGKYVAVHIDGKLRGAIQMIRDTGADCADAVTPKPMGDLTPAECRDEAGRDFILSGGVSPDLWLPNADISRFKEAVIDWLKLKEISPRFIANAGDQVPPGADIDRIKIMRDLVEEHGRY